MLKINFLKILTNLVSLDSPWKINTFKKKLRNLINKLFNFKMQFATSMSQNIILKFENTKKLFKKQTFGQMDWFIGLFEKLYLAFYRAVTF